MEDMFLAILVGVYFGLFTLLCMKKGNTNELLNDIKSIWTNKKEKDDGHKEE